MYVLSCSFNQSSEMNNPYVLSRKALINNLKPSAKNVMHELVLDK